MRPSEHPEFLSVHRSSVGFLRPPSLYDTLSATSAVALLPWVKALPQPCADAAISAARFRHYPAGATITMSGDEASLIAIVTGSVFVEAERAADDVGPTDWYAAPSSFLTGAALVEGASVMTITASTGVVVARWPRSFTFARIERDPQLVIALAGILGAMATRALHSVADMQLPTAMRRTAAIIMRLADAAQKLAISQTELGNMSNVSRVMTGAILLAFEDAGMVKLGYRKLVVRDRTALGLVRDGMWPHAGAALRAGELMEQNPVGPGASDGGRARTPKSQINRHGKAGRAA